jgi:hypothetical protein
MPEIPLIGSGGGPVVGPGLTLHCDQAVVKGDGSAANTSGVIGISVSCPGVSGSSGSGDGVDGVSKDGVGVFGNSTNNAGVQGQSFYYWSVFGQAASRNWAGVRGENSTGAGVWGFSGKAYGVRGTSGNPSGASPPLGCGVWGDSQDGCGVYGTSASQSPTCAGVSAVNSGGGVGVWAEVTQGGVAGHFEGDVEVTGDIRLLNQDCAEDFDLSDDVMLDAGTVVVLTERGSVEQCGKGYDKKAAGVVSGGGVFRPAIVLGRHASSKNRVPVALMGKVFCKVDAQYSAIEVGDLLTTSPTAGHAMKASDQTRALGAVIGKALSPFASGTGLIPILVALQ